MERVELCRRLLELGIGVLIQSSCLIVLGLIAGRLLRSRGPFVELASYRATLACVIVSALLAPVAFGRVQPLWCVSFRAPEQTFTASPATPLGGSVSPRAIPSRAPINVATARVPRAPQETPHPIVTLPPLYISLVLLWLIGAVLQILWLAVCGVALNRFMRRGRRASDGPVAALLSEVAARAGSAAPILILHPTVKSPFLAGVLRPAIVMPQAALETFGESGTRAVLAHELSHSLQRDCAWNLAFRLTAALLWPQVFLRLLHRRWQEAAEYACDQWVLAHACPPRSYADCLLSIAENRVLSRSQRILAIGVAPPFRSMLGKRLARIVDWSGGQIRMLSHIGRITLGGVAFIAAGGVLFLVSATAGARPVVRTAHRLIPITATVLKEPLSSGGSAMPKKNTALTALLALAGGAVHVGLPAVAAPVAPTLTSLAAVSADNVTLTRRPTLDAINAGAAAKTSTIGSSVDLTPPSIPAAPAVAGAHNVTLDFTDAPVKDVLKQLFTSTGQNYTIDPDVSGTVTVHLTNVLSDDALRTILRSSKPPISYELANEIYHIRLRHVDAPASPSSTINSEAAAPAPNLRRYLLPVENVVADDLLKKMSAADAKSQGIAIPDDVHAYADRAANTLMFEATPADFERLKEIVRAMDVAPRQCQIQLQMVEESRDSLQHLGIDPLTLTTSQEKQSGARGQALLDAVAQGKLPTVMTPTMVTASSASAIVTLKSSISTIAVTATPSVRLNGNIFLELALEITTDGKTQSLKLSNLLSDGVLTLCGSVPDPNHAGRSLLVFATATNVGKAS